VSFSNISSKVGLTFVLGVSLGPLLAGQLINIYGRRKPLIMSNFAVIILSALQFIPVYYVRLVINLSLGFFVGI